MAKRLTEKQKREIAKDFEDGKSIDFLSQNYNCTKLTVIRNLKKNLGELKYKELTKKTNKSLKEKNKSLKEKLNSQNNKISSLLDIDYEITNKNSKNYNQNYPPSVDSFFEIAPLDIEVENSSRKELSSIPISEADFPKVVYMVVDNKLELEIKFLKNFPEWDFLPDIDLNRKTIEIYYDLKIAKRSCNKDQKVIKVPNTGVFKIVAPILTSRGISRIVSSEKLIAL